MSILNTQKIEAYYNTFKGIDITFTKDMIQVTGLITEQVHLKCGSDFWPCVFFSTSFQGAKIVANVKSGLVDKLQKANNSVSLRYCFKNPEDGTPLTFFIAGRVIGLAPYKNSEDVSLLSVQFTQRPPDDLIEIVGRVFDANVNSSKRKADRIVITTEAQRKLKLLSKETVAYIQKVPRRCILREVAFSNAKVIMVGVAKFIVDKETALRLDFDDPRESFLIKGKFVHSEEVEGKQEMVALAMDYDEHSIPTGYKIRINECLNTVRAPIEHEPAPVKEKSKNEENPPNTEETPENP
jgi:hypothetical protein